MKNNTVAEQFNKRSVKFSGSAKWVTDKKLLAEHRTALSGHFPEKSEMLEVCCGTGEVSGYLKRKGLVTHGVDISPGMLAKAARKIKFVTEGDAHALPFDDNKFDVVVMRQAIQFLKPRKVLSEIKRVLKPGGILLLSHHVPHDAKERKNLLRVYRLLQPSGVFKDPSRLYLAGDLRAHLFASGFDIKQERSHFTTETLSALLGCYPNLTVSQKKTIATEYQKMWQDGCSGVTRKADGFTLVWKWCLFTAQKPS